MQVAQTLVVLLPRFDEGFVSVVAPEVLPTVAELLRSRDRRELELGGKILTQLVGTTGWKDELMDRCLTSPETRKAVRKKKRQIAGSDGAAGATQGGAEIAVGVDDEGGGGGSGGGGRGGREDAGGENDRSSKSPKSKKGGASSSTSIPIRNILASPSSASPEPLLSPSRGGARPSRSDQRDTVSTPSKRASVTARESGEGKAVGVPGSKERATLTKIKNDLSRIPVADWQAKDAALGRLDAELSGSSHYIPHADLVYRDILLPLVASNSGKLQQSALEIATKHVPAFRDAFDAALLSHCVKRVTPALASSNSMVLAAASALLDHLVAYCNTNYLFKPWCDAIEREHNAKVQTAMLRKLRQLVAVGCVTGPHSPHFFIQ